MKTIFFCPLECAMTDGVTVGHSVTLIHIAHMMVMIHLNLWFYGISSLLAEITFCWGIVNVRQLMSSLLGLVACFLLCDLTVLQQ
jgi:hypothetical protein